MGHADRRTAGEQVYGEQVLTAQIVVCPVGGRGQKPLDLWAGEGLEAEVLGDPGVPIDGHYCVNVIALELAKLYSLATDDDRVDSAAGHEPVPAMVVQVGDRAIGGLAAIANRLVPPMTTVRLRR
jgi:hypothetical protein